MPCRVVGCVCGPCDYFVSREQDYGLTIILLLKSFGGLGTPSTPCASKICRNVEGMLDFKCFENSYDSDQAVKQNQTAALQGPMKAVNLQPLTNMCHSRLLVFIEMFKMQSLWCLILYNDLNTAALYIHQKDFSMYAIEKLNFQQTLR